MREIKFKVVHYEAKFSKSKGWVIPKNIKPKIYPFEDVQWGTDLTPVSFINKKGIFRVNNPEDKCILLQYAGRKDKNGKEIYEGDIINFKISGNQRHGTVNFEKGIIGVDCVTLWNFEDIKVMGNIYENPKLLKKVKKWQD